QDGRTGQLSVRGAFAYVGRESGSADLLINSTTISRRHGALRNIYGRWCYADLSSTNGSWLNGEALAPNSWVMLHPGSELQLADWKLTVRADSYSGFKPLANPAVCLLKGDNYYFEQELDVSGQKYFIEANDDRLAVVLSPNENALCSVLKIEAGVELSLMTDASEDLNSLLGTNTEKLLKADILVNVGKSAVAFLQQGVPSEIDALMTQAIPVDPTVAIELETLDLSATTTMSRKVFDQLKTRTSSSVQEFQTRRPAESWIADTHDQGFWNNFEGKLVIALAVLLLFLIALIVVTWLLNPR
ncbi:MAG: FHA domain-containing protein, partial [Bdellovibrionales bacterium]|nr:FHA domain-containing protein [Bdellovibrionales bacterium]